MPRLGHPNISHQNNAISMHKLFLIILLLSSVTIFAEVRLPALFQDHMVLQQNVEIPVWGWANPGEQIHLEFAGQQQEIIADEAGEWSTSLAPMPYGGPYQMTLYAENEIVLNDILLGEVWLCSGQSNMAWTVAKSNDSENEIAMADYPSIRLFEVKRTPAYDEPKSDCVGEWTSCSPGTIGKFSAVAYFFGRKIHTDLNVPVGLIHSSWGGTRVEAWTSRTTLEQHEIGTSALQDYENKLSTFDPQKSTAEYEETLKKWETKKLRNPDAKKPKRKPSPAKNKNAPSGLFNGMIHPLIPYAMKGAIWYQGEANSKTEQDAFQYRDLLVSMIVNWRQSWGQGDFPFYFVQLPALKSEKVSWPITRESMSEVHRTTSNTGMVVTIDLEGSKNLHPRNKQDVGYRLALLALGDTYHKEIIYSGPEVRTVSLKGTAVMISFQFAEGGLSTIGDEVLGFELAGADGKYHAATANIVTTGFIKKRRNQVKVICSTIGKPVFIRYAWANDPDVSLKNDAGLPVAPFRYDLSESDKND